MQRVLGIDPGSHRTGWGVVEASGSRLRPIGAGTIHAEGRGLAERLRQIADALDDILLSHRPDAVAVETIFHAKNSRSALLLGHARGVALLCAARAGVRVFEYTAGQIKQSVTGRGRAGKNQVQKMVALLLDLRDTLDLDASDALAAAICHTEMHRAGVPFATTGEKT